MMDRHDLLRETNGGFFPSFGAAINFSEQNILKSSIFNTVKLRGSYGETGNTEIGSYLSLSRAGFSSYIFNGNTLETGASIDRLPNPDLTLGNHYSNRLWSISIFIK